MFRLLRDETCSQSQVWDEEDARLFPWELSAWIMLCMIPQGTELTFMNDMFFIGVLEPLVTAM